MCPYKLVSLRPALLLNFFISQFSFPFCVASFHWPMLPCDLGKWLLHIYSVQMNTQSKNKLALPPSTLILNSREGCWSALLGIIWSMLGTGLPLSQGQGPLGEQHRRNRAGQSDTITMTVQCHAPVLTTLHHFSTLFFTPIFFMFLLISFSQFMTTPPHPTTHTVPVYSNSNIWQIILLFLIIDIQFYIGF